jgi:predicted CXXCH cytochrome family protein
MKSLLLASVMGMVLCVSMAAQVVGDALGAHDFSSAGNSPVTGSSSASCLYCHAPHSGIGGSTPLWSQTLSTQTYSTYSSTTIQNATGQPILGGTSSLCLSCHDGTVAVGQLVPYGNANMSGKMLTNDVFGGNLQTSHPFSLTKPLKDSPNLVASLAASQTTADPQHKVKLINGTVECNSCHEPHTRNLDPISANFLVRDGVNGQLCLACHEPNARTVNGKNNPLAQWSTSVHAVAVNNVALSAKLGAYTTVAQFACISCHLPHNAVGAAGLLRGVNPLQANVDPATQTCMTCHNGGSNLQQAIPNVYVEFAKPGGGHPFPSTKNTHDPNEPAVLLDNRHATCADCHNAHSSSQVLTFPPAPGLRGSQNGVAGVSATDGVTPITPAVNQYESCLRCHSSSTGKQSLQVYGYLPLRTVNAADPLDVRLQFLTTATSSHPVLHPSTSPWPQPSLRTYMLNEDGITNSTRTLGSGQADSILCTDCHNADDNREFGGQGPSGPHGSQYGHILERQYVFSQVAVGAGRGTPIVNLNINPNLSAGGAGAGPYALCGKCHDLANIMSNASFKRHSTHVRDQGVSCSVCHTAHGNGAVVAGISGERMVNFDLNVVAQNGNSPITYSHATNSCTLTCHGHDHNGAN